MVDWQPIETAPKDGTPILVCEQGHFYPFVARWSTEGGNDGYWQSTSCIEQYYGTKTATHWMPLPDSPEN